MNTAQAQIQYAVRTVPVGLKPNLAKNMQHKTAAALLAANSIRWIRARSNTVLITASRTTSAVSGAKAFRQSTKYSGPICEMPLNGSVRPESTNGANTR